MKRHTTLPRPGSRPWHLLGATCTATAAFFAAAPAALAQTLPPVLSSAYRLSGHMSLQSDTWLNSYVECGSVRCDIAYSIASLPIDRQVVVAWKDTAGQTLISASNTIPISLFYTPKTLDGSMEAIEWSKGVLLGRPQAVQAVGTADFTGTGSGVDPCSNGYVCNDAEYYYWPSMWGPSGLRQSTQAGPVPLGTITGTLSNVGIDIDAPADIGDQRVVFLEFTSSVDRDNDHYVYRYTVRNDTDLNVPFAWAEAGLAETVGAFSTVQREFVSTSAPGVFSSLPSWTLSTDSSYPLSTDFASSLEIFAPVPEPAQWLQFGLGLAALLGLARRRRSPCNAAATARGTA